MKNILFNVVLALVWTGLTGTLTEWNFIAGFLVGALVIEAYTLAGTDRSYFVNGYRLLRFILRFLSMLIASNLQVAGQVLRRTDALAPRIVRYPVKGLDATERTTLANAITLTPGTLTVDISPDNEWLYVHAMFGRDADQVRRDIDTLRSELRKGVFQ